MPHEYGFRDTPARTEAHVREELAERVRVLRRQAACLSILAGVLLVLAGISAFRYPGWNSAAGAALLILGIVRGWAAWIGSERYFRRHVAARHSRGRQRDP